MTLGLALSPWQTADYPDYPSVGRFESDKFDPLTWKPHAPTTGYMEMQRRRRVLGGAAGGGVRRRHRSARSFTPAQFSDPAAEAYLGDDPDASGATRSPRAYLPAVNPIVNPRARAPAAI